MKQWTPQHQALLDALRSAHILPRLIRRISQERYAAEEDELRRMSEWPASLIHDPGWAAIEPMLDSPRAWPAAWERAVALGFSATTDHHHALYLGRLAERALHDEEIELAEWAAAQAYGAWRRVLAGDYMWGLLRDIVEPDPALEADRRAVVTSLLDPLVDQRAAELSDGLGLRRALVDGAPAALLRRRARFAMTALQLIEQPAAHDPTGALGRAAARARDHVEATQREAAQRFESMIKELDPATSAPDDIVRPFTWIDEISQIVGHDDAIAGPVIDAAVELGWTLRKVKRAGEQDLLARILEAVQPLTRALESRLLSRKSFGQNSKCADIYVFTGELEVSPKRRSSFERALAVCPGHRNAAMLLSYEELAEADALLTASKASGALSATKPAELVHKAHAKVREAARLYPHNKELDAYKARLKEAAERLNLSLDEIKTGAPDA